MPPPQRLSNGGLPHLIPKSGILSQHFAQKQLQFPADMVKKEKKGMGAYSHNFKQLMAKQM